MRFCFVARCTYHRLRRLLMFLRSIRRLVPAIARPGVTERSVAFLVIFVWQVWQ